MQSIDQNQTSPPKLNQPLQIETKKPMKGIVNKIKLNQ